MRFASPLIGIALASFVTGCSFDFKGLANGEGGAGGTGVTQVTSINSTVGPGPGPSVTSTNGSTSTVGPGPSVSSASVTTSATVDVASSSSTGITATDLVPCGIAEDDFGSIGSAWSQIGMIANSGNKVQTTADSTGRAGLELATGQTYTECYASIEITSNANPNDAPVSIGFTDQPGGPLPNTNTESVLYIDKFSKVFAPGNQPLSNQSSRYLGIAFHGPKVYYLTADNNSNWTVVSSPPRDMWLDDGTPDHVFFGVGGSMGATAEFDSFNAKAISITDLP